MSTFVQIPPPERRKRVDYYSSEELHEMLVDDAVKHRPLGGPGMKGLQWFHDAVARIAGVDRLEADAVFERILADVEAKTGRRWVAIG